MMRMRLWAAPCGSAYVTVVGLGHDNGARDQPTAPHPDRAAAASACMGGRVHAGRFGRDGGICHGRCRRGRRLLPPIWEALIALRLPGQNKLHWHDEGTSRRAKISAAIAGCDISAVVVVGIPMAAVKQERARVKCLERLLFELDGLHVEQVVLEARTPALNARDMKTVIRLRGREVISTRIRVEIGYPSSEPMLWTADAVAGAVSAARRGDGAWVAVLDEILTQIELPLR